MTKKEKVSFEEAMNLTGYGKFNYLTFMMCCTIIASMVFEIFSVGFLVPASGCELMTSSSQQGLMAGVPLISIIATSHFWGYLADTRGRRKVLLAAMLLACAGGALASLAPHWIVFVALKFLSSSAVSGAYGLAITLLSECSPENKRFGLLVGANTVFFFSNGLMALLAIPILPLTFSYNVSIIGIQFNSWRLLGLVFCIMSAISSVCLLFAFESPKYLLSVGEDEKALEVFRSMFVVNTKKNGDEYPVSLVILDEDKNDQASKGFWASLGAQTLPLFRPPLLKKTILLSILFIIVYMCVNPYLTWLALINDGLMKSVERGDEGMTFCERVQASQNLTNNIQESSGCTLNTTAMLLMAGFGTLLAIINLLLTFVVKFISGRTLFICLQIVAGVAGLLVNATTSWIAGTVFFVIFIAASLNYGFLSTFSVYIFPTYVKAMAVCITLIFARGSAVVGISLLKEMLPTRCAESFYVFAGITIAGGVLGFLLPDGKKKEVDQEA